MKRGFESSVVQWILLLAGLLVIFGIFYTVRQDLFDDPQENSLCYLQVLAHNRIAELSKGEKAPPIICPTKEVPIKASLSESRVKQDIALEMKRCWETWGAGEYVLFDEDSTYCHICSVVRFEERENIEDFNTYLLTTPIAQHSNLSYMEYLSPGFFGERYAKDAFAQELANTPQEGTIDTSKDYAIIFYHLRGEEQVKRFFIEVSQDSVTRTGAALGVGGASGLIVGGSAAAAAQIALIGVCGLATGGWCLVAVAGAGIAAGGMAAVSSGYVAQALIDNPPSHMSMLLFKPLEPDEIEQLRCQKSFARRG